MPFDLDALRRLITTDEGQYFDRKSLFEGPPDAKRHRDRRSVRDQVAKYVAAFANADGGTLVLGVEDDGAVTGCPYPADEVATILAVPANRLRPPLPPGEVIELDGQCLLVFEVQAAGRAVMVIGDGFPRRDLDEVHQSSEEAINQHKDAGLLGSPEARIATANLADLDEELIHRAMEGSAFEGSPADYLAQRRLADVRGDQLVLRQGAVWLFARSAAAIEHPNLGVRVWRVNGTEQRFGGNRNVQDFPRVEGDLLRVLDQARSLIATLIRSSSRLHDLFFREMPEYPPFAWQEALVNALAHRDYSVEGRAVEVWLYDDRMEVSSPGLLHPDLQMDQLSSRRPVHRSRNPRIARVLTELGVMRDQGEGIPRMFEEMELSWLKPPEFSQDGSVFTVVLRNEPVFEATDPEWAAYVRRLPLDVRQKRALVRFANGELQSADYQQLNGVDRDVAYRELTAMVNGGYLESEGATRGARYRVPEALRRQATPAPVPPLPPREVLAKRMAAAGAITNTDYREIFGVDRAAAKAALRDLVRRGVLILEGAGRGAHYVRGPGWGE
ncbi:MAG: putative DNA binding domain-containing protein [Myxococcales bacterium]|nr:putative DNA binding domain-containing protein [Myxococcales bacterium]